MLQRAWIVYPGWRSGKTQALRCHSFRIRRNRRLHLALGFVTCRLLNSLATCQCPAVPDTSSPIENCKPRDLDWVIIRVVEYAGAVRRSHIGQSYTKPPLQIRFPRGLEFSDHRMAVVVMASLQSCAMIMFRHIETAGERHVLSPTSSMFQFLFDFYDLFKALRSENPGVKRHRSCCYGRTRIALLEKSQFSDTPNDETVPYLHDRYDQHRGLFTIRLTISTSERGISLTCVL